MIIKCSKKKELLGKIFLNAFLPLFIGALVYLFVNKRTYISNFIFVPFEIQTGGATGAFIKNWLCDMLWSYALTSSLAFALDIFKRNVLASAVISFALGTALELLQLFNIISGTFDIFDIIYETIAILMAVCVIKRRKNK